MKKSIIIIPFLLMSVIVFSQDKSTYSSSQIELKKDIIINLGKIWGKAIRAKDVSLLNNLYAENAHYFPNDSEAFHGRIHIVNYWKTMLPYMNDLQLTMEFLEGTDQLLYETGKGVAGIMNDKGEFEDYHFKYVNIWELQKNGNYKVVVDIFNNAKN
jgi:ketosteroid isomerase-like protein